MPYPDAAWERAMTVQEELLKALSGELHWLGRRTFCGCRRGRCGGRGSATKTMAMWAWWTSGGTDRRYGGWWPPRWRACVRCIATGMWASMCATFTRLPSGARRYGVVQFVEVHLAGGGARQEASGTRAPSASPRAARLFRGAAPPGWQCARVVCVGPRRSGPV